MFLVLPHSGYVSIAVDQAVSLLSCFVFKEGSDKDNSGNVRDNMQVCVVLLSSVHPTDSKLSAVVCSGALPPVAGHRT